MAVTHKTGAEELVKAAISSGTDVLGMDIGTWNEAVQKAKTITERDPAYPDDVPAWLLYKQLTDSMP